MYKLVIRNGKFCIAKKADDSIVGEFTTKEQLRERISSLDPGPEGKVLSFGGAVKALDKDGTIGGYAVLFSGADDPDVLGDFFTKSTDFCLDADSRPWLFYQHALDPVLKATKLGATGRILEIKTDDVGIWVKAQLRKRDRYEKAILKMIEDGKLGWSVGSAPHLTERSEVKSDIFEIKAWPLIEVSLTPTPIEPRTHAVSLKSYIKELDIFDDRSAELKSVWSTEYRNGLPDSSFAYVAPGGAKDDKGLTKPRKLRHFPIKDADGNLDEAHVRDALSRIPQATTVSDEAKSMALRKVRAAAKKLGIEVTTKKSLGDRLKQFISDLTEVGRAEEDVIKALAKESFVDVLQVEAILAGEGRATNANLKAFSRVLGIDYELLKDLNPPRPQSEMSIRGVFEDELATEQYRTWDLWNAYCAVIQKLVNAKVGADLAGVAFDYEAKITEATDEYVARLKDVVLNQITDYLDQADIDGNFYLRSLGDPRTEDFVSAQNVDFDDHCAMVVSAVTSVEKRTFANHAARVSQKAGRVLSSKNHTVFSGYIDALHNHVKRGRKMLEDMKPKAQKTAVRSEEIAALRNEVKMRGVEMEDDYGREEQETSETR